MPVGRGKKELNNMERKRSLSEVTAKISLHRNGIVRRATSIGMGFGTAALIAGVIGGSPIESALGTAVITGSYGVRRTLNSRQNRN